ncbi:hypothetical protein BCR35DRAFT_309468 [Leucosporidium creatinivorum]|uniref:Uncharacterized protein n=1 Tax=Leucosporidium creatinivorum TaxID=106004 RepID=A0A1Y2DGU6_9BASI|nr:hypothetical protein BCR35DRAFT_309468 [Leucosporidium creatinivorum]
MPEEYEEHYEERRTRARQPQYKQQYEEPAQDEWEEPQRIVAPARARRKSVGDAFRQNHLLEVDGDFEPAPQYEYEERRSLPLPPPKPPKPPIAPAKANRIAAWSMGVQPVDDEVVEEPFAGPPPPARRARPKSTAYLEYDYTQPPPPPPNREVEDVPRLLKSAMKGGRARAATPVPSTADTESLDGIIDPFQPATVGQDAALHYGSWHPK